MTEEPRALRVCHVSPHLPPDQAANALLPAQLGRWGALAGSLRPSFVTYEPAHGTGTPGSLPGPLRRLPRGRGSHLARLLRLDRWTAIREITRALDDVASDADLLHLHSNGLIVEIAAAWARRRRRPYVLTLYGTEIWHYRRRRPIDPFTWAYHHAAEVTFYSRRLEERARQLGLERAAMHVVYPPVSEDFAEVDAATRTAWRTALGVSEPYLILNVKRLHELAGQRFLIEAFATLARRREDVRLVICGTGPLRQELETQAVTAGIAERVTFTGLIPNHEVARYAAVADVFALPSLLEALPTVAVEALASGTPVVSADHPGGEELHGIFGDDVTVVPRSQAAALARALEAALEPPRRTRPATGDLVREQFGPEAVQQAYMRVYARVLKNRLV